MAYELRSKTREVFTAAIDGLGNHVRGFVIFLRCKVLAVAFVNCVKWPLDLLKLER